MATCTQSWQGQQLKEGRFLILSSLDQGASAEVYVALDQATGTNVAVKTPLADLLDRAPDVAARFVAEAEVLRKLDHPAIVPILQAGTHDGRPYLVLPYFKGGNLARQIEGSAGGPLLPLLTALARIADALDYLHGLGYLHRAVKPSNILFDRFGQAYLGDLVMAKALQPDGKASPHTALAGPLPGQPRYLAPEQLQQRALDGRTDQFALAVTVYELLAGACPFPGASPAEVHHAQQWQPCRPAHELRPGLPLRASQVLHRGLALSPAQRHPSCGAFVSELLDALSSAPAPLTLPFALTGPALAPNAADEADFQVPLEDSSAPWQPVAPPPRPRPALPDVIPLPAAQGSRMGLLLLLGALCLALPVLMGAAALAGSVFLPGTALHTAVLAPTGEGGETVKEEAKELARQRDDALARATREHKARLLVEEREKGVGLRASSAEAVARVAEESLERTKKELAAARERAAAAEKSRAAEKASVAVRRTGPSLTHAGPLKGTVRNESGIVRFPAPFAVPPLVSVSNTYFRVSEVTTTQFRWQHTDGTPSTAEWTARGKASPDMLTQTGALKGAVVSDKGVIRFATPFAVPPVVAISNKYFRVVEATTTQFSWEHLDTTPSTATWTALGMAPSPDLLVQKGGMKGSVRNEEGVIRFPTPYADAPAVTISNTYFKVLLVTKTEFRWQHTDGTPSTAEWTARGNASRNVQVLTAPLTAQVQNQEGIVRFTTPFAASPVVTFANPSWFTAVEVTATQFRWRHLDNSPSNSSWTARGERSKDE